MKLSSSIKLLTALIFSATLTPFALAHEGHNKEQAANSPAGTFIKADEAKVSAEWLAQAKAVYPSDSCPVSDDKLEGGDMGPPQDYVYRQDGKPDRLVRLCCNHCVRDFKKDPAKYLKMIDDAAAAKAKAAPSK
jgi:hypothetical protein